MKVTTAKGYMFEVIIGELLRSSGYRWEQTHSGYLPGRGANHQFDAIGIGSHANPFVNNIRVLAEAKYLNEKVDLPIVRNLVGGLIDINESYNPKTESIAKKLLGTRETNCGVIFSNQDFTQDAIDYGYAHNIYLVSYKGNPVMQKIINDFENLCRFINFNRFQTKSQIKDEFQSLLYASQYNGNNQIFKQEFHNSNEASGALNQFKITLVNSSSVLGFISGSYPIHIMSQQENFLQVLINELRIEDRGTIQVGYHFEETSDNLIFTFPLSTGEEAYFVLPKYLFPEDKIKKGNLIEQKEEYLNNITVPFLNQSGALVVIRLQFNRNLV